MLEMLIKGEFWAPVLTSTALLGAIGAFLSPLYRGWIEKNIRHNLDHDLEQVRADFRREEELLRTRLKGQDDQLLALRSGALSQANARGAALDGRRMKALETLWGEVVAQAPAAHAMTFTSVLKMDELIRAAEGSSEEANGYKQLGKVIWDSAGLDKLPNAAVADRERPFLNPSTWALFVAHRGALGVSMTQVAALRFGTGEKMFTPDAILKLLKEAMPDWAEFIDRFGLSGIKSVSEELEKRLLDQIRSDLEGREDDSKAVARAANIVRAAEDAAASMRPIPEVPHDMISEGHIVRP